MEGSKKRERERRAEKERVGEGGREEEGELEIGGSEIEKRKKGGRERGMEIVA